MLETKTLSDKRHTVIIVSHVCPVPPVQGNRQVICHLISWLRDQGYRVAFVYQAHGISPEERKDLEERVDALVISKDEGRAAGLRNRLKILHDRGFTIPYRLFFRLRPGRRCWPETRRLVRELVRETAAVAVISQYIYMTPCFRNLPGSVLCLTQTHDMLSRVQDAVGNAGVDMAGRTYSRAHERRALLRGHVIIAIQKNEAKLFSELVPEREVITLGWASHEIATEPSTQVERSRVFMVAGDNPLNRRGVEEFCSKVWPLVLERVPDARFRLAGTVCNAYSGEHANVEALGVVPDLEEEYQRAAVLVNPVDLGTGLKIKTMEALAKGKALVSTEAGVEGLEFHGRTICLVAQSWEEFAGYVVDVLESDSIRRRLEASSIAYANEYLTERVVHSEFCACLTAHVDGLS